MTSYWINPTFGGPGPATFTWVVGEQQNLSWYSTTTYNISLMQEVNPEVKDRGILIYGIIYLFYMLVISNHVTYKTD